MTPEQPVKDIGLASTKALTIPTNRLAGSIDCMNCGTGLQGPFCYYCGQPDKNFMRFFPVMMRELLEDFLDFDSRFMRTIKPLLFKPGKLTRDYLDGRRFRYVPPLRLYIFSSIAFFFLATILATGFIQVGDDETDDDVVTAVHIGEDEQEEMDEAMERVDDALAQLEQRDPELAEDLKETIAEAQAEGEEEDEGLDLNFNGEPWDKETNPLIIPLMPDWVNDWINREIEESPQKGKEIEANPDLIKDKIFDVLPATMFVLLPIVALLFKFWYLFAKKYYIEHLIFALHNHSFIFVAILIMLMFSGLAGWLEPAEDGYLTDASNVVNTVILIWIPVYLLVSLKRVYKQGWALTIGKYLAIGISYMFLLAFATAFVALLSFLLL